jgi:hypothetical protein
MKNFSFFLILMHTCFSCKTSHEFALRDTSPVKAEEAPFISLLVKKKIAGLSGDVDAIEGARIRVNEVGPSKSLLIDFDESAFIKLVKAACDKEVRELVISKRTESSAELTWSDKYRAMIENENGQFIISCEGL